MIDRPFARAPRAGGPAVPGGTGATASRDLIGPLPRVAFLYILAVMLPVGFFAGPLYLTLLRLLLLIVVIPLTIQLLAGRFGRVMLVDVLFFLHIGWMTVALAVNNPNLVIQNSGSTAIEFLGGYLIGRACIRSRADFIALAKALGIAVAVTLPLALAESQTGVPYLIRFIDQLPFIRSEGDVNIPPRMGLERVQVIMTHPIHYGLFASSAFSLTVVALKDVMTRTRRFVLGAVILTCVFLSLSSGALLPTFVQLGLIVWAALFRGRGRPWLVLILLFVLAYVVVDLLSDRTPIRVFMSYATFSPHNAFWRGIIFDWGMRSVWAHPLYGIGLNDWVRPSYMASGSMDNFWLVMAVRYGIPGFLFLAVGYGHALFRVMLRDFGQDLVLNRLRRAWVFTFLGLTLTLSTVHVWTTMYSFVFFLFGAGMWLVTAQPAGGPAARAGPDPRGRPVARGAAPEAGAGPSPAEGAAEPPAAPHRPPYSRFPPVAGRTARGRAPG